MWLEDFRKERREVASPDGPGVPATGRVPDVVDLSGRQHDDEFLILPKFPVIPGTADPEQPQLGVDGRRVGQSRLAELGRGMPSTESADRGEAVEVRKADGDRLPTADARAGQCVLVA